MAFAGFCVLVVRVLFFFFSCFFVVVVGVLLVAFFFVSFAGICWHLHVDVLLVVVFFVAFAGIYVVIVDGVLPKQVFWMLLCCSFFLWHLHCCRCGICWHLGSCCYCSVFFLL